MIRPFTRSSLILVVPFSRRKTGEKSDAETGRKTVIVRGTTAFLVGLAVSPRRQIQERRRKKRQNRKIDSRHMSQLCTCRPNTIILWVPPEILANKQVKSHNSNCSCDSGPIARQCKMSCWALKSKTFFQQVPKEMGLKKRDLDRDGCSSSESPWYHCVDLIGTTTTEKEGLGAHCGTMSSGACNDPAALSGCKLVTAIHATNLVRANFCYFSGHGSFLADWSLEKTTIKRDLGQCFRANITAYQDTKLHLVYFGVLVSPTTHLNISRYNWSKCWIMKHGSKRERDPAKKKNWQT